MVARRVTADRRRRRHRRPRPRRRRAGPRSPPATSSSTPRPRCRFDSPLDAAVEVNLLGPTRIARPLQRPRRHAPPRRRVHLLRRRQPPRRGPRAARSTRARSSSTSTGAARSTAPAGPAPTPRPTAARPEMLADFRERGPQGARRRRRPAAGRARPSSSGSRWVADRMVEAGRARAASLGWPDAYAYTKALGERALAENRGDVPVSIVRPSIIESALAEPRPGWIRGFRMAEPVIISYARGLLKEFPGVPEGIVDVIPVDLVVAAIIAVAATGPEPDEPDDRPGGLRLGEPAALPPPRRPRRTSWFTEHPLYDAEGQPIVVPEWSFPGRGRVQGQLQRAKSLLEPGRERARRRSRCGASRPSGAPRSRRSARRSSGPSATSSSTAPTPSARPSTASTTCSPCGTHSTADDQRDFCFDPRVIDWDQLHPPRSTCRRSSSTPACAPRRAGAPARPARTACAARSSPPSASWRRSTSRTR